MHHSPGQLQLVGVKFNELECGVAMENNELCKYEPSSLLQGQCACETYASEIGDANCGATDTGQL